MTDVRKEILCLCIWHVKAILMPCVKTCNIFIQSAAVFVFHKPFFKKRIKLAHFKTSHRCDEVTKPIIRHDDKTL